jgi:hypothetical protein
VLADINRIEMVSVNNPVLDSLKSIFNTNRSEINDQTTIKNKRLSLTYSM